MPTDSAPSFAALAPRTLKVALLVSNSTPFTNTLPNASMRPTATAGVWFEPAIPPTVGEPPPPQPINHRLAAASANHFCNRMSCFSLIPASAPSQHMCAKIAHWFK